MMYLSRLLFRSALRKGGRGGFFQETFTFAVIICEPEV